MIRSKRSGVRALNHKHDGSPQPLPPSPNQCQHMPPPPICRSIWKEGRTILDECTGLDLKQALSSPRSQQEVNPAISENAFGFDFRIGKEFRKPTIPQGFSHQLVGNARIHRNPNFPCADSHYIEFRSSLRRRHVIQREQRLGYQEFVKAARVGEVAAKHLAMARRQNGETVGSFEKPGCDDAITKSHPTIHHHIRKV